MSNVLNGSNVFTLDTNILIYFAVGDPNIADFIMRQRGRSVVLFLPTIAAVEFLSYPALNSEDKASFHFLLAHLKPVPLDMEVAYAASDLRREYGLALGDSVVAATAVVTKTALVTRNVRDFRKVPQIRIERL